MARTSLMKIALVIALTIAAGTAYASSQISSQTSIGTGGGSFSPSNNVTIGVASSSAGYSANSKHLNGDRVMGIINTDSKIYFSSNAPVGSTVNAPSATNTYSNISGGGSWTSL